MERCNHSEDLFLFSVVVVVVLFCFCFWLFFVVVVVVWVFFFLEGVGNCSHSETQAWRREGYFPHALFLCFMNSTCSIFFSYSLRGEQSVLKRMTKKIVITRSISVKVN